MLIRVTAKLPNILQPLRVLRLHSAKQLLLSGRAFLMEVLD